METEVFFRFVTVHMFYGWIWWMDCSLPRPPCIAVAW